MRNEHYGDKRGLELLSYNAIFNFALSNRNYGKTWCFKKRAVRRAFKHGKKTIWIRMFKNEAKEASSTFFSSKDLRKYIGIELYDAETKKGNVKQVGNVFYYRKGKRWEWFLKLFKLGDVGAIRSADDVDVDTIVFDEFTKTPEYYHRFRGNIATAFIDIFFSAKREHQVRCILLGNRESTTNPFFKYFGIKPLPNSFEGIKTCRKGSIAIQQINNKPQAETEYDEKLMSMLEGTSYGNYIYKDANKLQYTFKARKTPHTASIYVQLYIDNTPLKISVDNGYFYVNQQVDNTKSIYCDIPPHLYAHEHQLVKRYRRLFSAFVDAIADNRVYYDTASTREAITPFMTWLSV